MRPDSIGWRVSLWLALNPDTEATLREVSERFDVDDIKAWQALEAPAKHGFIEKRVERVRGGKKVATYRAGPTALELRN